MRPRRGSPPVPRRWRAWQFALGLLVAAGVGGVALVVAAGDDPSPSPAEIADDPGVAHVHGLGINPADGSLIVATHNGSFRLPADSDDAERIGDSFQDTMGFTVAGPDHFLGSGHPDVAGMQAGQPGRLGLIESTDAGATWTILSLGSEVDFHALAFAHDQVYGWDSGTGRFMVSTDRTEWETRSTLDLFGFAVDPHDADHIIGTGPAGLHESTDGGRTWDDSGGPQLVALSWDLDAGLWGADSSGGTWHKAGPEWEQAGSLPGQPQALLATGDTLYAATHDEAGTTGIYRSTDQGRAWELRYRDAGAVMVLGFLDYTPVLDLAPGPLTISPHGLGTAVGFLAGARLMLPAARARGIDDADLWRMLTRAIIGAVIGARLAYVLNHLDTYRDRPLDALRVWEGGASLLGGIVAAVVVALPELRRQRLDFWTVMDAAAPGLALGIAIGRVGDLLVADHLGKPTDFVLGYRCTGADTSSPCTAPIGQVVHQPALYDLVAVLALLGFLLWLRRRPIAAGTLFLAFTAWYGTGRVAEDFLRIDETHGLFLTASQWFAVVAIVTATVLLVTSQRPGRRPHEPITAGSSTR